MANVKPGAPVNPSSLAKSIIEQRDPVRSFVQALPDQEPAKARKPVEFVKIGINGFDKLAPQGIPIGSSALVCGGPGTGKTIFCLQVLYEAARQGKKCLYMSFEESVERLEQHMAEFNWDYEELEKKGLLKIVRLDPFGITRSVRALLEKAKGELLIDIEPVLLPEGYKPDYVAIDSLSAISAAFVGREESYRTYLEQLFKLFEKLKATSFLIAETEQIQEGLLTRSGVEEFLADAIILLYNVIEKNQRERGIEVLKIRGAPHKNYVAKTEITDDGIKIYPDQKLPVEVDHGA